MKLIIPLLIGLASATVCHGQGLLAQTGNTNISFNVPGQQGFSNGDIKLTVNGPISFRYNNLDEMTQPKVIADIFKLKMKAKTVAYKVAATVSFNDPLIVAALTNKLKLRLLANTPPGATILQSEALLSSNPTDLFMIPVSSNSPGAEQFKYFDYDLVLLPLTQFISTGNYTFTITFTMTQP